MNRVFQTAWSCGQKRNASPKATAHTTMMSVPRRNQYAPPSRPASTSTHIHTGVGNGMCAPNTFHSVPGPNSQFVYCVTFS